MSFLKTDSSKGSQSIKPGTYEMVITKASHDASQNGKEYILIGLTVRNDLDQSYKNAFHGEFLWPSRDTGEFNQRMLQTIIGAVGVPDGKEFDTEEEYLQTLMHKPVRVTLKEEEYNGEKSNKVGFSWSKTDFPEVQHQFKTDKDPFAGNGQPIDISDDDLPF